MAKRQTAVKTADGDAALREVLGVLYESVMEPDILPDALRGVADLTGAHVAFRGIVTTDGQHRSLGVSRGSYGRIPDLLEHAWDNPWTQTSLRFPFGKVMTNDAFLPFEKIRDTPFYGQVLRPLDIAHAIGCNWLADQHTIMLVTVFRSERQGRFPPGAIACYEALAPHLERSGLLTVRLSQARAAQQTLLEALHRLRLGLLIVDESARVRFANHSAERVLASNAAPLQARCGQLTASTSDQTCKLRELISHAARAGAGLGVRPGGTLLTSTTAQERPLEVVVSPLPIGAPLLAAAEPAALVTFRIDADPGPSLPALLQQLYDLTPAEARVAQAILGGHGLGSAAEALGVQLTTARTHLYHVFEKTGTHRQAELVRLLAGFAALLADDG